MHACDDAKGASVREISMSGLNPALEEQLDDDLRAQSLEVL